MVLATHIVVGSAVASIFPNHPLIGFSAAFASHFVLDAIPHWEYKLKSRVSTSGDPLLKNSLETDFVINRFFVGDLFCIGIDILIGILLAIFALGGAGRLSVSVLTAGALGAVTPDSLQFVYTKIRREPLVSLQRFHQWVHIKKHLRNPLAGIIWQLAIVALVFLIL
jgi:hypothetical protein